MVKSESNGRRGISPLARSRRDKRTCNFTSGPSNGSGPLPTSPVPCNLRIAQVSSMGSNVSIAPLFNRQILQAVIRTQAVDPQA